GLPAAWIVDSPGVSDLEDFDALIQAADTSDMVLWVCSAARAARAIDAGGLAAIRRHFAAETHRLRPPMILVLTHTDALRPFTDGEARYDLASGTRAKSQSIRAAMEAVSVELGFPIDHIVPVRVDIAFAPYNVDAVWAKIIELMPETQRARLLRVLADIRSASAWGALWSQAASAGRVIKGALLSRSTTP